MDLPVFRYHPDPVASGSISASGSACVCCGKAAGFLYTGPVYSEEDLEGSLCPWCIASGRAARKFDATFTDSDAIEEDLPPAVIDEIVERTPGFASWQGERWPVCCGDATAFLYPAGSAELRAAGLEGALISHIVHEMGISGGAATRLADSLHRDKGPTAYLFRCRDCEAHRFVIDRP